MEGQKQKVWVAIIVALITAAGGVVVALIQTPDEEKESCQFDKFYIQYAESFQLNGYEVPGKINPEWSPKLSNIEVIEFKFYPDSSPNAFFEKRHSAVQKELGKIVEEHAGFIDIPALIKLNNNYQSKNKDRTLDPIFAEMFTVKYDSIINFNCHDKSFLCKMGLAYDPKALRFPPELSRLISAELLKIQKVQDFLKNPLNVSLDFTSLKLELAMNNNFNTEYCNKVESNWEHYRIFYPNLRNRSCDLLFKSGDYNVNPVSIAIVKILAKEYSDYVRLRPDETFQLISKGYCDGTSIQGSGIPYNGYSRWSSESSKINYSNPVSGELIGKKTSIGHEGNHQLAYIRAFTGLTEIKRAFELLDGGRERFLGLNPVYVGEKPPKDNISSQKDRRIEFKLIKL